jgi:hypothetical protein
VSARHTTVLDREGLLALFGSLRDRRLVGVVDGGDCIELAFEHDESGDRRNLVSIFTEGRRRGLVAFGGVAQELIEAGYGR